MDKRMASANHLPLHDLQGLDTTEDAEEEAKTKATPPGR